MTEKDSTPQAVRRLVELVAEHGLTELTVEADGTIITIRAEADIAPPAAPPVSTVPIAAPALPLAAAAPVSAPRTGRPASSVALESPMVGVFYRSPSPEDPPFVVVGDMVRAGQPIGMIEAMKVFSEVPAEVSGRVVEISAESGKLVQQGQPLIYVEPA